MIQIENNEAMHHLENSVVNLSSGTSCMLSSTSSSASSSINYHHHHNHHHHLILDPNGQSATLDSNNNAKMLSGNLPMNGSYLNSSMMSTTASSDSLCGENELSNNSFNDFVNSKTNLIVNYLPQNMTQDEIKSLFASIGPVDSCKLIKDKLSGQSLGYAFVNYEKQEDAEKAIDTLNGMRLQNKTIKVSLARPSSESIKNANLYVCGLPKDFAQDELEKMFNQFGVIISSKILTDPKTGVSKGVGFVRFDQRIEAEMAIAKLNSKQLENMPEPLVVKFANSPTSIKSVMGLPLAPFVPTCRSFFQPYRPSTNSSYRYSPMNSYCAEPTLLQHPSTTTITGLLPPSANQLMNTSIPCGPSTPAPISVSMAPPPQPLPLVTAPSTTTPSSSISNSNLSSLNYSGYCIFVYNLGPESDEGVLWQLFGPFGAVQSVKVIRDGQTQKCKGFGFVTMTNYDEALMAINCLNGLNLQNRILQVSFKTSKSFY